MAGANNTSSLELMQRTELEIAKQVDAICRRHNLRYSLIFGSLIGAVRHKGFIPWDDDIDILMPRDDFELLLQYAVDELPDYYEVQNFKLGTSKRYVSRIADKRTLIRLESYGEGNDLPIWFDIFVLDGIPDGKVARELRYLEVLWRKATCAFAAFDETVNLHRPGRPKWQQLIIDFCAATQFGHLWNLDKNLLKYDKTLKKDSTFAHKDCFCGVGTYDAKRQTWPAHAFLDLIDYEFEDTKLMAPRDFDAVLSVTYGEYMTLPPEDQRAMHRLELLKHPLMREGHRIDER